MKRTKALLIGIQHYDKEAWGELSTCHRDVDNMEHFLTKGPWRYEDVRVLKDIPGQSPLPDRQTMIDYMHWLVKDATPGDQLLFFYSGHGSQRPTRSYTEEDGFDETLVPLSCPGLRDGCPPECDCHDDNPDCSRPAYYGMIRDNELKEILVEPLPGGCRLVAIFDCCTSGSILDLGYFYTGFLNDNSPHTPNLPLLRARPKKLSTQRTRFSGNKTPKPSRSQSKGIGLNISGYSVEDMITCESPTEATSPVFGPVRNELLSKSVKGSRTRVQQGAKPNKCDLPSVIALSACMDGCGAFELDNDEGGALTTKLIQCIHRHPNGLTYEKLILELRRIFAKLFERRKKWIPDAGEEPPYPVLSCNYDMNIDDLVLF